MESNIRSFSPPQGEQRQYHARYKYMAEAQWLRSKMFFQELDKNVGSIIIAVVEASSSPAQCPFPQRGGPLGLCGRARWLLPTGCRPLPWQCEQGEGWIVCLCHMLFWHGSNRNLKGASRFTTKPQVASPGTFVELNKTKTQSA